MKLSRDEEDQLALAAIARLGLYVIQSGDSFAISVDNTGNDPTPEQLGVCYWYGDAGTAAYEYCKRNDIDIKGAD